MFSNGVNDAAKLCEFHGGTGTAQTCAHCSPSTEQLECNVPCTKVPLEFLHSKVHERRKSLNLTFEQVGNACGTSKQAAMGWERNSEPKGSCLLLLSRLLGVNPWEFYHERAETEETPPDNNG